MFHFRDAGSPRESVNPQQIDQENIGQVRLHDLAGVGDQYRASEHTACGFLCADRMSQAVDRLGVWDAETVAHSL